MPTNPYEWFPNGKRELHRAAAAAIRKNPDLVQEALGILDRWVAREQSASRFSLQWRELLLQASASPQGLEALLELLEDDAEEAEQMKSYSPMACILDCETIDKIHERRATPALG